MAVYLKNVKTGYLTARGFRSFLAPVVSYLPAIQPAMPSYYSEKKYEGPEAVVVAMDIGTTQSERAPVPWLTLSQSSRRGIVRPL